MNRFFVTLSLAAGLAAGSLPAWAQTSAPAPATKAKPTAQETLNYALGYRAGMDLDKLRDAGETIDADTVVRALRDALDGKSPALDTAQLNQAMADLGTRMQARGRKAFEDRATANQKKSEIFLFQNRAKDGVKVLPSGLQYRVLDAGSGRRPGKDSQVSLEFKTTLPEGRVLADTSVASPESPAGPVSIKVSEIPLAGVREALLLMPEGARWQLAIPADLAYGSGPEAADLANQVILMDLHLVKIQ